MERLDPVVRERCDEILSWRRAHGGGAPTFPWEDHSMASELHQQRLLADHKNRLKRRCSTAIGPYPSQRQLNQDEVRYFKWCLSAAALQEENPSWITGESDDGGAAKASDQGQRRQAELALDVPCKRLCTDASCDGEVAPVAEPIQTTRGASAPDKDFPDQPCEQDAQCRQRPQNERGQMLVLRQGEQGNCFTACSWRGDEQWTFQEDDTGIMVTVMYNYDPSTRQNYYLCEAKLYRAMKGEHVTRKMATVKADVPKTTSDMEGASLLKSLNHK